MINDLFGNYPFPSDLKKPAHITNSLIKSYVAPVENIYLSDLNKLFVSTNYLTVGMFHLAPGSSYDPPDIHEGDEAYYILDGILTEHNPQTGEFMQVRKGESLLVPMYGYHKGYNFEQDVLRVLFVIAPKVDPGDVSPVDFKDGKMKMYKGKNNDTFEKYGKIPEWNLHGTTDDIGQWPIPGPDSRKEPVFFYHITENKKLINVHGTKYPMLVKFFVSNDLLHMGEFILPAGGTGCRASEPDSHKGDCILFVESGPITVFLPKTQETFYIQPEEVMFIPEGTEYQLINYTCNTVKAIFSIAPNI